MEYELYNRQAWMRHLSLLFCAVCNLPFYGCHRCIRRFIGMFFFPFYDILLYGRLPASFNTSEIFAFFTIPLQLYIVLCNFDATIYSLT